MNSQPWYITPKHHITEKHAIIIGGGLAGTSSAYSIAKRDWEVTLIERSSSLATGGSGNPAGIISPMITHKGDPIGKFYLHGFEYVLKHLQNIKDYISYSNCGVVELSASKINKDLSRIINSGISALPMAEAANLCGIPFKTNALYIPDAGYISPGDLCNANIVAFKDNIRTIFSTNILSLEKDKNNWVVADDNGNKIAAAPVIIIASAFDARSISQASYIPLHPVRGQLTYLSAQNLNLKTLLCYDGGYITPEINGIHYVGATYGRNNLNEVVTEEDHIENIANLRKVIDIGDIDYSNLQGRVSFRAGVPDRRPVIGLVPDIGAFYNDYADLKHGKIKDYPEGKYLEGLYISAGHGSRGLTSCPLGGEILAAMVDNEELPVPVAIANILSPARFVIGEIKRGCHS